MSDSVAISQRERVSPAGLRRRRVGILFVLSAALTLLAITIFPLIYELRLVFMSWELTTNAPPRFVGLLNLGRVLFQDERFWASMRVTGTLIVLGVAIQPSIGTGLALLLNRLGGRLRTPLVSVFLIPVMIAPVVAGFQFRMIYHDQFGICLNGLFYIIGIDKSGVIERNEGSLNINQGAHPFGPVRPPGI